MHARSVIRKKNQGAHIARTRARPLPPHPQNYFHRAAGDPKGKDDPGGARGRARARRARGFSAIPSVCRVWFRSLGLVIILGLHNYKRNATRARLVHALKVPVQLVLVLQLEPRPEVLRAVALAI